MTTRRVSGRGLRGLELTTRLSDELGDDVEVVLIDRADGFVFGFSKLDVMFGRTTADAVFHPYRDIVKPGVRFVQAEVTVDRPGREAGRDRRRHRSRPTSWWSRSAPTSTPRRRPGWSRAATSSTREEGAFALRDVLAELRRRAGDRRRHVDAVQVPARAERDRAAGARPAAPSGVREQSEITLVMPLPVPIPPSPAASEALLAAFAERGITFDARAGACARSTRRARSPCSPTAPSCPTTSSSASPSTCARRWSAASGMCVDGWIPVDPHTLETSFPDVYAVGDVTSVGTPKAGVFAEGQADGRRRRDHRPPPRCGRRRRPTTAAASATSSSATARSARSTSRSCPAQPPVGTLDGPSRRHRGRQGRVRGEPHPALVRRGSGRRPDDVRFRRRGRPPRCPRRTAAATCPC